MMKKDSNSLEKKIFNLRKQIDFIDSTILDLINVRLYLAENIGRLKREGCWCIVDDIREVQILSKLKALNKGLLDPSFLYDIFSDIIAASRAIQMKKQAAYVNCDMAVLGRPLINNAFNMNLPVFISNPSLNAIFEKGKISSHPHSLVFLAATMRVDCSYFFDFLLVSKTEMYTEYYNQTKYGLVISVSDLGVVYIYVDLLTRCHSWSQRCIFI